MKEIVFKVESRIANAKKFVITTHELLTTAINQVPAEGFNVTELSARLGLLAKIDTVKSFFDYSGKKFDEIDFAETHVVEFDETEVKKLKKILDDARWAVLSPLIIDLADSLK